MARILVRLQSKTELQPNSGYHCIQSLLAITSGYSGKGWYFGHSLNAALRERLRFLKKRQIVPPARRRTAWSIGLKKKWLVSFTLNMSSEHTIQEKRRDISVLWCHMNSCAQLWRHKRQGSQSQVMPTMKQRWSSVKTRNVDNKTGIYTQRGRDSFDEYSI